VPVFPTVADGGARYVAACDGRLSSRWPTRYFGGNAVQSITYLWPGALLDGLEFWWQIETRADGT
jgi:hypothetical protein